ncbi:MAG: Arc family DNA-binding protein [Phycisphaerae bacterium]|nr:Arc family DNA-binding protein [Phycisphaerae bacterium]MCZ2399833.1 Arc family DNA-binding protein [Phycisphaerae bacterium]
MADRKSFLVRLPADLLDELNRWARDELRSLNAQIEYLLRDAVRKRRSSHDRSQADGQPPDRTDA